MKKQGIKVFAPATVANVAVGYDILGFAVNDIGDELIVRQGENPGLKIKAIHNNPTLSKDINKNTAGFAAQKLLEALGLQEEPIEIELIKNMGIGTGLGSSAASAVAGVFGVNEYLGSPFEKKELLRFATMAEELADGSFHADNVAPSLLGGFILIRDNQTLDTIKLPCPLGLKCVLIYPDIKILTQDARSILRESISLEDHVVQSGNLAAFVAALYKSDMDLLSRSLKDVIIEPQRSKLIPLFDEVKELALSCGALGYSISGAGPSMFALCASSLAAENISESVRAFYRNKNIVCNSYISDINLQGAKKY